jgi:hypothetical protein
MEEDQRKEIEELIGQMKCPKDFECIDSGFTVLCHPRDIELELFLECWQEKPVGCQFLLPLGYTHTFVDVLFLCTFTRNQHFIVCPNSGYTMH